MMVHTSPAEPLDEPLSPAATEDTEGAGCGISACAAAAGDSTATVNSAPMVSRVVRFMSNLPFYLEVSVRQAYRRYHRQFRGCRYRSVMRSRRSCHR